MYEIIPKLLNVSLTASILVPVVIVLRFCLRKAPKRFLCILWSLVALRLLCPVNISSSFSAFNLVNEKTGPDGRVEYFRYNGNAEKPELTFEIPVLVNDEKATDSMTVGRKTSDLYLPTVAGIWLLGVGGMLLYAFASYRRLRKETSASIHRTGNIFICDDINTPFILGVIRPKIYLPSGSDEGVREYVIAHEQAHIRRLDYLWKPLGFLLLSIHWFNPVLWVAYVLLCKDIEAACDEKVIAGMDKESIAGYSEALLAYASKRRMITACPIAFGETDVKGRIRNVLNYRKPAFWIVIVSIVVISVVAICFLTNPVKSEEEKEAEDVTSEEIDMTWNSFGFLCWPLEEGILREEWSEEAPYWQFAAERGTKVYAVAYGTAISGYNSDDGNYVEIFLGDTADTVVRYCHLEESYLDEAYLDRTAHVNEGAVIGTVGMSGNAAEPCLKVVIETDRSRVFVDTPQRIEKDFRYGKREGKLIVDITQHDIEEGYFDLKLVDEYGKAVWSRTIGTAHVGWDRFYYYEENGTDYLIQYHPEGVSQGMVWYSFRMFSIDEAGNEIVAHEYSAGSREEVPSFMESVKPYMNKAEFIVSTTYGRIYIGR